MHLARRAGGRTALTMVMYYYVLYEAGSSTSQVTRDLRKGWWYAGGTWPATNPRQSITYESHCERDKS